MSNLRMLDYPECPVCSTKMKVITDYIDVLDGYGPICEQCETCPNGCYAYEFTYGYTNIYVTIRGQHIRFDWSYDDVIPSQAITLVTEVARKAQLEDYWVLVKKYGEDQTRRSEEPRQPSLDNGLALL